MSVYQIASCLDSAGARGQVAWLLQTPTDSFLPDTPATGRWKYGFRSYGLFEKSSAGEQRIAAWSVATPPFTPTVGSIPFVTTGGHLTQDNVNLFWDDTNNILELNSPATPLVGSHNLRLKNIDTGQTTKWSLTQGWFDNVPAGREDVYLWLGYNLNTGGGRAVGSEPALGLQIESYVDDPGGLGLQMECHMTYISTSDVILRPWSFIISKTSSVIDGTVLASPLRVSDPATNAIITHQNYGGGAGRFGVNTLVNANVHLHGRGKWLFEPASGAVANNKFWDVDYGAGETFVFRAVNDAYSAAGTIFQVERTGTTVDSFEIMGSLRVDNPSGDVSWKSGTAFDGTFAHANTANRTYTFPDATGTLALLTDIPWSKTSTVVHLLTGTDEVHVGGTTSLGKFAVTGDGTTEITALVRMAASQTASGLVVEKSDGTDLFTVGPGPSAQLLDQTGATSLVLQGETGSGKESVFNEQGGNLSTRMEGDTKTKAFYLSATDDSVALFAGDTHSGFGGGIGVLAVADAATVPSSNPSGGGILYSEAGAGKWRAASGTITTFGPSDPHCPECGADFTHEWESEKYGYLAICVKCLADELGDRPWIRRRKAA